ncbi:MAG: Crp/Fnr family transcriptional regulator [Anaerolineae bacterium]|jgi:CRP-like cAMP-binding protein
MDTMARLQQIPLFAGLPAAELDALARALNRRHCARGELILHQGDPGDSLYIVVSGRVRIYTLSPEGHELSVWLCDEGDFFGEMALLSDEPRSANAEAMLPTEVLVLSRGAFRDYLLAHPGAALHAVETLSRRLRRTTESAGDLACRSVVQRIARTLVELAGRYGVPDGVPPACGVRIELEISQEDMATLAGTTRESANRALGTLRDRGIVELDRSYVRILRPEALEAMLG